MYYLYGFILTVWITSTACLEENVIFLKKMEANWKLTARRFHEFNAGHVIYNYFDNVKEQTAHLGNFHNLQYTGKMAIGNPEQTLNMIFDLGNGDIIALTEMYCRPLRKHLTFFCRSHGSYDEYRSSTRSMEPEMNPKFDLKFLGDDELTGHLVYDTVKVANWTALKATVGVIEQWKNGFHFSRVDGLVGLGRKEIAHFHYKSNLLEVKESDKDTLIKRPTLIERLQKKGLNKVGFHLYKDKKGNEVGELVLGAESDRHRRKEELVWIPQEVKVPRNTHWNSFWTLNIYSIDVMRMGNGRIEEIPNKILTIPDPGTSLIIGPIEIIDRIHAKVFKGLKHVKKTITLRSFEFDCRYIDQLPIIIFRIEKKGYLLEPKDYVKKFRRSCTTGFMGMKEAKVMIIGDVFMRKYYTVFDFANNKIGLAASVPPE